METDGEVKDAAFGPDEQLQAFGSVIRHGLQEAGDRGQERVHVESRVKQDHVRYQAGGTGKHCIR